MNVKFHGIKLDVEIGFYANGQRLIQLWQGGAPYMTASVALEIPKELTTILAYGHYGCLPEDIVFIKNWSENEGIFQALCDAGIIIPTGHKIPTGYVEAHVAVLAPQQ